MARTKRERQSILQEVGGSPLRRVTRALARSSPKTTNHPEVSAPSPPKQVGPKRLTTRRKGAHVSPLLDRLKSITEEWERERDARTAARADASSVRCPLLQDSQEPEQTVIGDVMDDDTIGPTQGMETTGPITLGINHAPVDEIEEPPEMDEDDLTQRDEPAETEDPITETKRGRGAAKMPCGWGGDTPMTVFMARDGRSIIGPDVKDYKSGVGVIARNGMRLPLRYSSF
ncbi:uncharacterized protein LOC127254759 [Andrographis paniculata]|uniref:uncharacterized protein LOC127254759 n=1 Tax=Andrographis paniculata TaxID=175694 RepID=UPI0021E9627C|nr:uncharacterized protein LOC127254759 [Andrographis paniculata]